MAGFLESDKLLHSAHFSELFSRLDINGVRLWRLHNESLRAYALLTADRILRPIDQMKQLVAVIVIPLMLVLLAIPMVWLVGVDNPDIAVSVFLGGMVLWFLLAIIVNQQNPVKFVRYDRARILQCTEELASFMAMQGLAGQPPSRPTIVDVFQPRKSGGRELADLLERFLEHCELLPRKYRAEIAQPDNIFYLTSSPDMTAARMVVLAFLSELLQPEEAHDVRRTGELRELLQRSPASRQPGSRDADQQSG